MHYYVLDGESYEVYYKTVFKSKTRYSQEEFLEIVKKAYNSCCEEIYNEYDFIDTRCDFLIGLTVLWEENFNEIIEKISDLEVIKADEWIHVGLSITPNENSWKILNTLQSLDCLPDCRSTCSTDKTNKKYHCVYNGDLNDG